MNFDFKKNLYAIKKTVAFYFSINLILVDILKLHIYAFLLG